MNYSVMQNGQELEVFEETVFPMPYNANKKMECVSFILDEKNTLEIRSRIPVKTVQVRPLSCGIVPVIEDGVIKVELLRPQKFSVEINGSYENNLMVFAEEDKYAEFEKNASNVIYFKEGVHKNDIFYIRESNSVVYIEKGAVLNGKMMVENCENVTICGYGKITMEGIDRDIKPMEKQRALEVCGCKNVTVKDILITDSANWSLRVMGCDSINIDNIKIIGCRGNSDGIDVCGSKNITVKNIFTRTWDDSFVVKALDTGDTENILFCNSILWNDFARPIEVGVELRADNVRNVRFENIDIIHSPTGYPLLGIHHGDRARVRNIFFSDIRIEDTPGAQLFDIRITKSVWNRDNAMGDIEGVFFKNIYYIGKPGMEFALSKSRIQGFSEEHCVRNVVLENICLLGKTAATNEECGVLVMDYVYDVKYICPPDVKRIKPIMTRLDITKAFELEDNGMYSGEITIFADNVSDTAKKGRMWLLISPVNTASVENRECVYEIKSGEKIKHVCKVTLPPGKYVFSVQSDEPDVNGDWRFAAFDMILGNNIESAPVYKFHNYYGDTAPGIQMAVSGGRLILKSDILTDNTNAVKIYAAMPVEEQEGEVKFSVEETDFGEVPAVILGKQGLELAPQLRCPAEITYVFKNEPKVERIYETEICTDKGYAEIDLKELGISGQNFWIEIEAKMKKTEKYRYPYTLFHSVKPDSIAHMFANVITEE